MPTLSRRRTTTPSHRQTERYERFALPVRRYEAKIPGSGFKFITRSRMCQANQSPSPLLKVHSVRVLLAELSRDIVNARSGSGLLQLLITA
jgi:hypothetical protein